jgi:hypothetical protein
MDEKGFMLSTIGRSPDKVGRQKAQDRLFKIVQENGLLFWSVVVQLRVFWIRY